MRAFACTLAAILLAGCGKSAPLPTETASPAPPRPKGELSAEQVADQARGSLSCPDKAGSAEPVVDILGVRPGMSYEEAAARVMCSARLMVVTPENSHGYDVNTSGITIRQGFVAQYAVAHHELSGREIVKQMQRDSINRGMNARREGTPPGESRWYVGTMGIPGQERVTNAAREERYAPGQQPSIATLQDALVKKYGVPSLVLGHPGVTQVLRWIRDPQGQLAVPGSPLVQRCAVGPTDPDSGFSISEACGLIVSAQLVPSGANPELADRLGVGVVDSAGTMALIHGTEQALAERKRSAQEAQVRDAEKHVAAPSL